MAEHTRERLIEWNESFGCPTKTSLNRLRSLVCSHDKEKAIDAFYAALRENYYPDLCRPERVEVRGKVVDVWAYHTGGWSGNEDIIEVLKTSWLFELLLERYDRGGHFYFRMPVG